MHVVIGLVVVAVGTVLFHFLSPWWWTPIASNWGYIDNTILITFWITGVVFIAVILFTAYCVMRFKFKPGARAEYRPENAKLEWWLTVLTSLGVAGMLTPGLFVWNQYVTVPEDAAQMEVMGQQWAWSFRLPGKDGKLGVTNARLVNGVNPFGLDPKDPNGQDDLLIQGGELHVPLDRPVKVLLRSIDVLHDFYVPEFRAKMDMVPGLVSYFWFKPIRTGKFDILCFELCGIGHHAMRGSVVVDNDAAYQKWLGEQTTFRKSLAAAGNGVERVKRLVSSELPGNSAQTGSAR